MTDYLKVNLANWNDRAAIHVKDEAGGYRVKEFLDGATISTASRTVRSVMSGEHASPICSAISASTHSA